MKDEGNLNFGDVVSETPVPESKTKETDLETTDSLHPSSFILHPLTRSVTLVVAAVITDGEKIFITQRLPGGRLGNQWEFPGGKLEWGEPPEAGLQREIREETGLEIEVGDPLHIIHYALDSERSFAVLFYWCRISGGTLQLLGCQDARWIRTDEFAGVDFLQANLPVVARLQAHVRTNGALAPVFATPTL